VDVERLCWRLRASSVNELRKNLSASLAEKMAPGEAKREPCWTESLAVGSVGYLEKVKPLILSRQKTEIVESADKNLWSLQEESISYGQKTGLKNEANGLQWDFI
jgi:hypothetical protein